MLAENRHDLLRLEVGQGEKYDIGHTGEPLCLERMERERRQPTQVRVCRRQRLAGEPIGGHGGKLHLGMAEEQPQQLCSHVAAGPGDSDANHVRISALPLRVLELLASTGLPILLPLPHPGVTGEQASFLERLPELLVEADERTSDAVAYRPCLSSRPAAADT